MKYAAKLTSMLQNAAAAAANVKNFKFLERVTQYIIVHQKIACFWLVKQKIDDMQ